MHIAIKTGINVTHLAARWGIIVCALCSLIAGLDDWFRGEQLASLRPYLAASASLASIWFASHRQMRWAAFAVLVGALHLFGMAVSVDPPVSAQQASPCFRTLVINAYGGNVDQNRFAQLATRTNADVVIVSELGKPLDITLRKSYPHAWSTDANRVFGIGIYSTFPIESSEVLRRGAQDNPVLRATLRTSAGQVQVVALHPLPPGNTQTFNDRNALIQELAESVEGFDGPVLIAGDFNTTTWSRHLRALHHVASRAPTSGTWPARLPMRIPIDHIFFTGLGLKDSRGIVGEYGSDHVPILADLCALN